MQHCDGGRVGALVRETVPASSTDSTAHLSHLMQESGLEPLFKCNTRPALIVKDHTTEIDMDLPLEGTARELLIHRTYLMNIYYVPEDYKKTLELFYVCHEDSAKLYSNPSSCPGQFNSSGIVAIK